MNRLKVCTRLLNGCNRFVYSISNDGHSHGIVLINNATIYRNLRKCFVTTSSACVNYRQTLPTTALSFNYATKPKKIVYSCSNKISGFSIFGAQNNWLLHHQSSLIALSKSYNSIRCFSEASQKNIDIPMNVQLEGIWKDLSESAAVEFCQNGFVTLHTVTGLPWWATIILATWGVRAVVTLPLALYQNYILAKVENLKFEMDDIVKELKMETNFAVHKFKWTEDYARKIYNRSLKKQWQKLIERENCHPMKSAVILVVQIPMWIILSTSLRNLCYMLPYPNERAHAIYLELTTEGFGWVTNLAAVDHSLTIPITLGLLNLAIIEMQTLMRTTEQTKVQKYLTHFFRLIAVGMIPLAAYVPAGMSLYWASSSAFGIVQNLTLMSPRVRRLARIPPTDNELDEPYKHLYAKLRQRIGLKKIGEQKMPLTKAVKK